MKFERILAGVAAASLLAAAAPASAAVIASAGGGFTVGIGDNGELYDGVAGIGFARADGFDPIAPGTPRDSWGINTVYADGQFFGSTVASTSVVAGADSAVATTETGIGFLVEQTYSFFGEGNILKIETVVTNTSGDALAAIFQRNVDWDFPTGDHVFGYFGSPNGIVDSSYYGFESPDPVTPYGSSCKFGCNQTGDLGGGIKINLGTLNAGASRVFTYYYGLSRDGSGASDLIADAQAAGAEYMIVGSSEGASGPHAIIGVSGAVPEPATWAMMLLGFFSLGAMVRRRRLSLA